MKSLLEAEGSSSVPLLSTRWMAKSLYLMMGKEMSQVTSTPPPQSPIILE
jgi:hypothetical protein